MVAPKSILGSRPLIFTLLLALCNKLGPSPVTALFEDQAFKFDWRQQYIGAPDKIIAWHDSSSSPSDLILSITKSNVVAALVAESGALK